MGKTKKATRPGAAKETGVVQQAVVSSKASEKAKRGEKQPAAADKPTKQQPAAAKPDKATKQTKKRAKDEIEEIFGKSKKLREEQAAAGDAADEDAAELQQLAKEVEEARKQAKKPKVEGSKDDIFGEQVGKPRKRTEEGYAIYGEDELGLGKKGGDTPLCPFDCDCCY